MAPTPSPLITSDAVVFGLLAATLGIIFYTSASPRPAFRAFYRYVPVLLLCYFVPSLYTSFGLIDPERSGLYAMASRILLPATLVLITLSIDFKGIVRLGPKALIMFLTGTFGVLFGGPLAVLIFSAVSPETVGGQGPDAVWRGLSTIAGSWIGGGANQAAMKEIFEVSDEVFSAMVAVDIFAGSLWMAFLLFLATRAATIDRRLGADTSAIDELRLRVTEFRERHARIATLRDVMMLVGIGFGITGLSHLLADPLAAWIGREAPALEQLSLTSAFFWVIVFATTFGLLLSFTRARELEGVGASTLGSAMLYILIATIGMSMDITAVVERPGLFALGAVWLSFHALLMLLVAWLIKAPMFYFAVGSQANIGGAASAPVVAAAFHPSLAPVGVLLAVLGYALGTYGAWLSAQLMRLVAP
jgi:uncharacterized membrane protein